MKKLFTLVVMMCLLGASHAWADYIYFANNWDNNVNDHDSPLHNYTVQRGVNDTENTEYTINVQLKWWGDSWGIGNVNNDYTWYNNNYGDNVSSEIITTNQGKQIKVKGKGGAVVIDANGVHDGTFYHTFFVITLPPLDNYVWDFFGESTESQGHTLIHPEHNVYWSDAEKTPADKTESPQNIKVADIDGAHVHGSHSRIDGTNAFYLPSTAGMIFDANEDQFGYFHSNFETRNKGTFVERELVTFGNGKGNNRPYYVLPQVKGGKYVKVWCNAQAKGKGGQFHVENLLDLDGNSIDNGFTFAGVTFYGECLGCLIFKVKGNPNERKNVKFTLWDHTYWNDIYKIEITDEYSTDLELDDITNSNWNARNYVQYNNQYAHIVHDGNGIDLLYSGTPGPIYIQRGCTCEFDVYPENGVTIDEVSTTEGNYHNLQLNGVKGTGNIRIVVKEIKNGYVLDKKETWIAVGTYTQQSYPYTWDFMDWNMKQKQMLGVLDDSHTHGFAYGYWNTASDNVRSLETHEPVDASKGNNNYIWNNVPVDRPLFAQGAQLSYRDYDASENLDINKPFKEAEGLRMKQYWGDEIGAGSTYDGEISLDGNFLNFNPTVDGHKLVITIPNVPTKKNNEDMWLFVKSSVAPQSVYAATDKANAVKIDASVPTKCNLETDVKAYKITSAGDVEVLFTKATSISAIGVTHIFKSINALGYATESRDVDIDHEYEGVFTKNDVNAYCIQTYDDNGFTYEYKGLPLVKKSTRVHMVPKNTGIVLYADVNPNAGSQFNVPLFYPACNNAKLDMSDNSAEYKAFRNNWMAPCVSEYTHTSETVNRLDAMKLCGTNDIEGYNYGSNNDVCTKFVMSRQYYVYHKSSDGTGSNSGELTSEQEAFYRMRLNSGVQGTSNTMGANKAYLLIPTAKLPLALWNPQSNGEGKPGLAKPGVIFMDDIMDLFGGEEPISGIATAIDAIESTETVGNGNTFHTLSGMQIQGVPTQKGVYIVNGKKVLVK